MNLMIELLASAHHADLLRETHNRRLKSLVTRCRRRILGVLPIGAACEAQPSC
ncbi:MAG: hypothetical protein ABIP01_04200 [Candidatus Limnocylindria bacterium]